MQHVRFVAAALGAAALAAVVSVPARAFAADSPVAAVVPNVRLHDLGMAAPATQISLAITLNYRNSEQLERLVALQSDPGSPYFRHWLTSAQFATAFAPTPLDYQRAAVSLERAGFRVKQAFSNRTVIDVTGTVADAERYFQTAIDRVYQPGYGMRYTNVRPAIVPRELRDLVYAVNGLNDLAVVHTDTAAVERRNHAAPETESPPYSGPVSTLTGYDGYGPLVFARSYDFPSTHATKSDAYDGTGRTAAIVIDADFLNADIAAYLKYFGVKRTGKIQRVAIDGGTTSDPGLSNGDSLEATLDVEVIASGAPGANLDVYETAPFGWGVGVITDAYNTIVSQNKADSVNSSFGICETADESVSEAWNHIFVQGAALGITFHAATGDDGSNCNGGVTGVNAPASAPYAVAIGGTSLDPDKKKNYEYGSETVWPGSGGGVSTVFKMPVWQTNVKGMLGSGRNLPDFAFDADPLTGVALYYAGTWNNPWNPLGGTSLASPIFGTALAQIEDVTGGRLGLAARSLFQLWSKDGYTHAGTAYFHDITSGSNGIYTAVPGYDRASGIGSIDVWNVARALE